MPNVFGFNNLVELLGWWSCEAASNEMEGRRRQGLVERLLLGASQPPPSIPPPSPSPPPPPPLHPPWQIGAVDKLELSTSALRQQQAATPLRCDQIRTDQNRSEHIRTDQNRSEQIRTDVTRSGSRATSPPKVQAAREYFDPVHEMKPKTLKTHLPAPAHQSSLCFDWMCFLLDHSYIFCCSYFGTDCIMQC